MWHHQHQPEEEPGGVVVGSGAAAAAAGLHEFQFFGHDEDHDSVTWLFNDPAPHLHRGPAPAATVGNGVAAEAAEQPRAPPPLFDGYAHAHAPYGQLPGHGLTFDVPLGRGGEVQASAAVLEAGLGLGGGGGGGGSNPATTSSGATIVSGVRFHLSPESCMHGPPSTSPISLCAGDMHAILVSRLCTLNR
jgi:hypothetical protein